MAGTSSNRAEELARISQKERNNQNGPALSGAVGPVKHSGIGTSLQKNSVQSGGINRATKGTAQK
jgi:hypothetical protein